MTKHKDPQEDNEEMIREQNRREEERKLQFPCASNLSFPLFPQGFLTEKRRRKSKEYKGIGRPRKTDYEYKSILDMLFDINQVLNLKIAGEKTKEHLNRKAVEK